MTHAAPFIKLIWAQARHATDPRGVIGFEGAMPWHLPEDLVHFKRTTGGCAVVMGRKTWDSLPARFRPLPGRRNIVITRARDWASSAQAHGAFAAHDLPQALALAGAQASESNASAASTIWMIGGGQVYAQGLPLACNVVVTEIDLAVPGDTFAPALNPAEWRECQREARVSAGGVGYAFVTYERTQPLGATPGAAQAQLQQPPTLAP